MSLLVILELRDALSYHIHLATTVAETMEELMKIDMTRKLRDKLDHEIARLQTGGDNNV